MLADQSAGEQESSPLLGRKSAEGARAHPEALSHILCNLARASSVYTLASLIYPGGMAASVILMSHLPELDATERRNMLAATGLMTTAEALVMHTAWVAAFAVGIHIGQALGQGCDLKIMSALPADLSPHQGSYILVKDSSDSASSVQLFYIRNDGSRGKEPVKLLDDFKFQTVLDTIIADAPSADLIALSGVQLQELIQSNGGHLPDHPEVGEMFRQSVLYTFLTSIPVTLILAFCDQIFRLLGESPDLTESVAKYYHAFAWGCTPSLMMVAFEQLALASNRPGLAVLIASGFVGTYLGAGTGLMYGTDSGVAGMGYGRSISGGVMLVALPFLFKRISAFQRFHLFTPHIDHELTHLKSFAKTGLTLAMQLGSEFFGLFAMLTMAGRLSENALAASQSAAQALNIGLVPLICIAQAAGISISSKMGAGDVVNAKRYGDVSLWLAPIVPTLLLTVFTLFPEQLLSIFIDDHTAGSDLEEIQHIGKLLLLITALTQFADSMRNASIGALRGLGDLKAAMYSTISMMCVSTTVLGGLLAFTADLGSEGLFIARGVSVAIAALWMFTRWNAVSKATMREVHAPGTDGLPHTDSCWALPFEGCLTRQNTASASHALSVSYGTPKLIPTQKSQGMSNLNLPGNSDAGTARTNNNML